MEVATIELSIGGHLESDGSRRFVCEFDDVSDPTLRRCLEGIERLFAGAPSAVVWTAMGFRSTERTFGVSVPEGERLSVDEAQALLERNWPVIESLTIER